MEITVTCKDVMSHICESMGEEQLSPRCIAIKNHMDNCECCNNYFKSVEKTIDFYRNYEITMPEEAHDRLLQYLDMCDCDPKE